MRVNAIVQKQELFNVYRCLLSREKGDAKVIQLGRIGQSVR
jgi:hypothetical protein